MPRRRPSHVRAQLPIRRQGPGRPIPQVARVSAGTLRAIALLERDRFEPGAIAEALGRWAKFVRGPVQAIRGYEPEACGCHGCQRGDPVVCREVLRVVLHALPVGAARELFLLVRPLDELYLARSIPDPEHAHVRDLLTVAADRIPG